MPAILWLGIVFMAILMPGKAIPDVPLFPFADKFVHLFLFAPLTFLWARIGTINKNRILNIAILLIHYFIFGICIPILSEYLQKYVPNRSFDPWDIYANIVGGTIGIICLYILYKRDSKLV
jgi:VanZ family protein